jgi:hypothetical protein
LGAWSLNAGPGKQSGGAGGSERLIEVEDKSANSALALRTGWEAAQHLVRGGGDLIQCPSAYGLCGQVLVRSA